MFLCSLLCTEVVSICSRYSRRETLEENTWIFHERLLRWCVTRRCIQKVDWKRSMFYFEKSVKWSVPWLLSMNQSIKSEVQNCWRANRQSAVHTNYNAVDTTQRQRLQWSNKKLIEIYQCTVKGTTAHVQLHRKCGESEIFPFYNTLFGFGANP